MSLSAKKFFISNSAHPCTEIAMDANLIRQFYLENGWEETQDASQADDLIVSTCAYNQQYEDSAIDDIKNRKTQKKVDARLITTGCLSKINPERFAKVGGGIAVPPLELETFDDLIKARRSIADIPNNAIQMREYESNPFFSKLVRIKTKLEKIEKKYGKSLIPNWMATIPTPDWFFIRGAVGCRGNCSYCAVRHAKGTTASVPMESILRQIKDAASQGAREISLAGDDMGAWGSDMGWDLAELLTAILLIPGNFQINLRFVEPLYFMKLFDKLSPLFATGRISAFCLPIQSGSNSVLGRMRRQYTIEKVEEALTRFSRIPKRPRLASILMVGFPGETWEDFLLSCALIDRLPIDMYQILQYEGRPNTASITMPDQIPPQEKQRRHDILLRKFKLQKVVHLPSWLVNKICGLSY